MVMKVIKKVLFVVLTIVAIILITALFVDNEFAVTRSLSINKPSDEVFQYVRFLKNQDEYGVWDKMDPNMEKSYTGTDGEVGFIFSWNSDKDDVGQGEQEITAIEEGERIEMKLRFKEPMETTNDAFISTEAISSSNTKVTWGIKGKVSYPWNITLLFINMDEMLGDDLQKGLENLKVKLEQQASQ